MGRLKNGRIGKVAGNRTQFFKSYILSEHSEKARKPKWVL